MDEAKILAQIDAMNAKMDLILEELDYQKRKRIEAEDLKDDIIRVGSEVFDTAVHELEGMSDSISTGDIAYLFKKLLRNINNITATFEQLESLKDMSSDLSPLMKSIFQQMLDGLNEADRKGYFLFFKEVFASLDRIVSSMDEEEMRAISRNVESAITLIRLLTRENVLQRSANALAALSEKPAGEKDYSHLAMLREQTGPEVRRSMMFMIQFLKEFHKENKD